MIVAGAALAAMGWSGCSSDDGDTTPAPEPSCLGGSTECGGVCTNTNTDSANCGSCGNACPAGQTCDGSGNCALTCQDGLVECSGVCTNTATDNANCGSCGNPCGAGEVCDGSGTCAVGCQPGLVSCNGTCIDPQANSAYCGASGDCAGANAGTACVDGPCVNGSCVEGCPQDLIECNGVCIDPLTDSTYCGASGDCAGANAGTTCLDGFKCDGAGACALSCQSDLIDCNAVCIDPLTDNTYCGASGDCQAPAAGTTCDDGFKCDGSGACALTCQSGLIDCNGTCIDPLSNPSYCGASGACQGGTACTVGEEACVDGVCTSYCVLQRANFQGGVVGPVFDDGCWTQCSGYLDIDDAGDQIPLAWGADCMLAADNVLRIVCGNSAMTTYRYIDVSKNVFRDLLASNPESGLITDARDESGNPFTYTTNDIYADINNDPNAGRSWWGGPDGCTSGSMNLTVNNIPSSCREVENCFGLSDSLVGQDVFLGAYVQE